MPSPVRSPKNSAARWGSNSSSRTRAAPAARLASTPWRKSAPDGYTLAISAVSPITLLPHLGKLPFDPVNDVAPVASVMYSPVYVLATPAFTGKALPMCLRSQRRNRAPFAWPPAASRRWAT